MLAPWDLQKEAANEQFGLLEAMDYGSPHHRIGDYLDRFRYLQ